MLFVYFLNAKTAVHSSATTFTQKINWFAAPSGVKQLHTTHLSAYFFNFEMQ